MDQSKLENINSDNKDHHELDDMKAQLAKFEKFVARRFDEISMEINATSQLLDMAEDGADKRFNEMVTVLSAINNLGDGSTSANSGAELEAAVLEAEAAATKILDSCEKIGGLIEQTVKLTPAEEVTAALEHIDAYVQEIFLACSFQDLVGQRIRTALAQLRGVETELTQTLSSMGLDVAKKAESNETSNANTTSSHSTQASQDDIDALFD